MWPKITTNYSPNFSLIKRKRKKVKYIILHYTGMKKQSAALKRLCNENSKVSSHYFIKKNGNILRLVPDLYEAWHAGESSWKKDKNLNKYSIGIEIHNSGHDNIYEQFSLKQINSIKRLLKALTNLYKINYKNVLGHSDVAPERKKDPGEKFPWKKFGKLRLTQWHKLDEKKLKKFRSIKLNMIEENNFLNNLNKIGYSKIKFNKFSNKKKCIVTAFQRRFRSNLVNGFSDKECLLISKNLIKS